MPSKIDMGWWPESNDVTTERGIVLILFRRPLIPLNESYGDMLYIFENLGLRTEINLSEPLSLGAGEFERMDGNGFEKSGLLTIIDSSLIPGY